MKPQGEGITLTKRQVGKIFFRAFGAKEGRVLHHDNMHNEGGKAQVIKTSIMSM